MDKISLIILSFTMGGYCILSQDKAIASTAPFMVSIVTRLDQPRELAGNWHLTCGGVIIKRNQVLTTGSCVEKIKNNLGKHDVVVRSNTGFWQCNCGRSRDHTIAGSYIHPKFGVHQNSKKLKIAPTLFKNDIGVITVNEPFHNHYEKTAGIIRNEDKINMFVAFGFGQYAKRKRVFSAQLRSTTIDLEDKRTCNSKYGIRLENAFCQKPAYRGGTPCLGDVGGPLMGVPMFMKAKSHKFGLDLIYWDRMNLGIIGLISSIDYVCNGSYPTVYTNVSTYTSWIRKAVLRNANPDAWY